MYICICVCVCVLVYIYMYMYACNNVFVVLKALVKENFQVNISECREMIRGCQEILFFSLLGKINGD